jgi:hypothetical protein
MDKFKHWIVRCSAISLALFAIVLGVPATGTSQNNVRQVPINEFLKAQSSTADWFDPVSSNFMRFDAFGKRNSSLGLNLGTDVSGQMTIRSLGGGQEQVNVLIKTSSGLCWGYLVTDTFVPAFGRNPLEILSGAAPSVGDGMMRITYTQAAGSAAPPWDQILNNEGPYRLESVVSTVSCQKGELRSGSGYPDGTPGFAQTAQRGIFTTGAPGGCPLEHDADCYPAEKVQFKPSGN